MTKAKFWSFSCDGDTRRGRFHVDEVAGPSPWPWRSRFQQGTAMGPGEWPDPPPQIQADPELHKKKPVPCFEDLPWSGLSEHIVSDRLRTFLEAEAPGAAEYLPVELVGPGSENCPHRYWVVNWLCVFDCLDEEASMNEDENGRYVEVPVIDASRIPDDGVIGVLNGYRVVVLIRNDLRLKMKKAEIIGPQFYGIAHSDGTNFEPFIKPDAKGGPGKIQFPTKLPSARSGRAGASAGAKGKSRSRGEKPMERSAKPRAKKSSRSTPKPRKSK